MTANLWFYIGFLGQILVISLFLPRQVLHRIRYLVETYPLV